MVKIDTFLVNLDVINDYESNTLILLKLIKKTQFNKILLLDYSAVRASIIQDSVDKSKIDINHSPEKTFEFIKQSLEELKPDDFLLVIGGEKLINDSKLKFEINKNETEHTTYEDILWNKFFEIVENIYGEFQQKVKGIYFNININIKNKDIIFDIVEQMNNFSLTVTEPIQENSDYEELQWNIIESIKMNSLEEMMVILKNEKEKLDEGTYRYFKALTFRENGAFSEVVKLLTKNYKFLINEEKLLLAESYIFRDDNAFAEPILQEIFQKDKYLKGLINIIVEHNRNTDNKSKEKWLKKLMEIDSNNHSVLEFNASYLAIINKNKEAAEKYRELKYILSGEDKYYELIARINDLISSPPTSDEAIHYILKDYLDTDLENEARYKLAVFLTIVKKSVYSTYSVLRDANLQLTQNRIEEITKLKLEILEDNIKASRALGKLNIYRKDEHSLYLIKERMRVIIESIPILANTNNGYLLWRKYIDTSQSDQTWRRSSYKGLIEEIQILLKVDYSRVIPESFIFKVEETEFQDNILSDKNDIKNRKLSFLKLIKMIRKAKSGEIDIEDYFSDLEEFKNVVLVVPEALDDIESKIWSRYYLSTLLAYRGEIQNANDHALTLLEISINLEGNTRDLSLFLGLIAWGNSQYRIGRITEGIICLISALKFHKDRKINEYYPIIEDAISLISRFLSDNKKLIEDKDIKTLVEFSNKLSDYNHALKDTLMILGYIEIDDLDEREENIRSFNKKDLIWATHLSNLIAANIKNGNDNKAIEFINEFGDDIINELSLRIDIRFNLLYSWASLYFKKFEFEKMIYLLEISLIDIEKLREVSHKEERSGSSELYNEIYRFYAQGCAFLYSDSATDIGRKKELKEKLLKVIPKLSPISVNEQKKTNSEKNYTEELKQAEKALRNLKEEYRLLLRKGRPTDGIVNNKAYEIEKLTEHLKELHPYYQKLIKIENVDLNLLGTELFNNELFYQIIITPITVISIIITKIKVDINIIFLEQFNSLEKLFEEFSNEIQEEISSERLNLLVQEISTVIASNLINAVKDNPIDKVYFMPDFKMSFFPLIISEVNDTRLIDHIKSLVNVIDYNVIFKKNSYNKPFNNILNRIYGKPNDPSLKIIDDWLEESNNTNMIKLKNSSDDIKNIFSEVKSKENNSLILYGHGLSDPESIDVDGSIGIEGRNQLLLLDDILNEIQDINNFILISCKGGSPYYKNPESSSSMYTHILEKFEGNIILCKWDVPTKQTIELLDNIIDIINNENYNIDEAVFIAQKNVSKINNYNEWAGLEIWIN